MDIAKYTTIELLTPNGPEHRQVSTAPPRLPTADEIPVVDLSSLEGDLSARRRLATEIRAAAENTGFFYISNHGISEDLILSALTQVKRFFAQPIEQKEKIAFKADGKSTGYRGVKTTQINKTESKDNKETFSMQYDYRIDPSVAQVDTGPNVSSVPNDDIWKGTGNLEGFGPVLVEFWQRRLELARKMIRIFALALDLPEDYFDAIITHPGADAVHIHYPGTPQETNADQQVDVGLGSHTDIQCLTLLWQDMSGGLQVLSASGEWLDARPIEGTMVVNIGDFLQRLSNNKFKSTVHRVYNAQKESRYSMPFFLGFNPDAVCEVVPTCVDETHPALYEPISCGKWHRDRLTLAQKGTLA